MLSCSRKAVRGLTLFAVLATLAACSTPQAVTAQTSEHDHPEGSYPPVFVPPVADADAVKAEVEAILLFQQEAWNAGDIRTFMVGYARHDSLVFISGDTIRRGWQNNLYAYVRNYPDTAAMGTLAFEELEVRPLTSELAIAYGIWRLEREADEPHGRFSLVLRKFDQGWRIIHDHTSSGG